MADYTITLIAQDGSVLAEFTADFADDDVAIDHAEMFGEAEEIEIRRGALVICCFPMSMFAWVEGPLAQPLPPALYPSPRAQDWGPSARLEIA